MNPVSFEKFPAHEREELALCGITTAEQFCRCSASELADELRLARNFFPERRFVLTEERLCAMLSELQAIQHEKARKVDNDLPFVNAKGKSLPSAGFHHCSSEQQEEVTPRLRHHRAMLHSPVRCSHPWLAVFAALSTLLLLVPVMAAVSVFVMIITQTLPWLPADMLYPAAAVIALTVFPYIIYARMATCPVCHMRIFRYHRYTRNRAAHYFPLLGYNMTTALHLIFRAFYVCPGCGTPVKLIGSKGRRNHC